MNIQGIIRTILLMDVFGRGIRRRHDGESYGAKRVHEMQSESYMKIKLLIKRIQENVVDPHSKGYNRKENPLLRGMNTTQRLLHLCSANDPNPMDIL